MFLGSGDAELKARRRLDQLRQAQKDTVGLNTGAMGVGTSVRVSDKPTLASQGIDKNLAHQARRLVLSLMRASSAV